MPTSQARIGVARRDTSRSAALAAARDRWPGADERAMIDR
jgi:hypothetical protein